MPNDAIQELELTGTLLDRVKQTLELPTHIPTDLHGLRLVYAAWCANVPFDNIQKMVALRSPGAAMPGHHAADFFENWLMHGCGGTCWPSSNALYQLLLSLGFNARRVAASMFDIGSINHGTIKVVIAGQDWLVDTSIMSNVPLPLTGNGHVENAGVSVEIEPVDSTHIIWTDFVPLPEYIPCRLIHDPVDSEFYLERYETYSRQQSPFNSRLYIRTSGLRGARTILGTSLFARWADGSLRVTEFSPDELCTYVTRELGYSGAIIDSWIAAGGLDSTMDPSNVTAPPEIKGQRPSKRAAAIV